MNYFLFCENFVSGKDMRVTGTNTKNVVDAIHQAEKMNEKLGDSCTISVQYKPKGMLQKCAWYPG